ncbi:hypothetical protein [Alicyclobacillus dauci]|uniref:Uncharacterized protein n=1 Tax=Alicyclobacillus dauci TaxID=1475485 RepID=A0ABY6Z5Z8_9BACL|nr:hypothetical protein [Alicyclobacillus dauci]WAH38296.1 hypothetical protein NZD86_07380 [Alicyclobacillus dauci]
MDWITPIISGSAGVIGAAVGVLGNIISFRSQRKSNEIERLQKLTDDKFAAYNEVLDVNGREPILQPSRGRVAP